MISNLSMRKSLFPLGRKFHKKLLKETLMPVLAGTVWQGQDW